MACHSARTVLTANTTRERCVDDPVRTVPFFLLGDLMVARIWHGRVPANKSEEYLRRMRTVAIPNYRAVPGNRGAFVLHRIDGNIAHFLTLTFWESRDAIAGLVGEDIEQAFEPFVAHYDLYSD
jgi:heme-degrading monooxygenase HmoA